MPKRRKRIEFTATEYVPKKKKVSFLAKRKKKQEIAELPQPKQGLSKLTEEI